MTGTHGVPLIMGPNPYPDASVAPGIHIWGWMSSWELWWLHDTAATMTSVCDVGSLRGRSAFALATGCPGPVYAIDPFDDPGNHAWAGFRENCGHLTNLYGVKGWSPAAAQHVPDVDITFIDADHEYESVRADIAAWLPKTRRLLCGHDYSDHDGFPGVKEAVDEAFGGRVRVPEGTSIWTVQL